MRKDIRKIEKAMTHVAVFTAKKLGIADPDVKFKFDTDEDATKDVLETAKQLKDLGIAVDLGKLKTLVKYDLFAESESEVWQPDGKDEAAEA